MHTVLSFGELVWDIFPNYKKPGGSPANLAYHLHCLNNRSYIMSKVGNDENGKNLISFLEKKGLPVSYLQTDERYKTGLVTVTFKENEPSYTIHQPSAWDYIEFSTSLENLLPDLDAICYASLSQRNKKSAKTVEILLKSVNSNCLKVFDLNLRPPFVDKELIINRMHQSNVIKLNEHEYETVSKWIGTNNFAEYLINQDSSKTILITLGANGSEIYSSNGYIREQAAQINGKGDFVGVGDAFLACFTHLKLLGATDDIILKRANNYAAYVASYKGGMPTIPANIKSLIHTEFFN